MFYFKIYITTSIYGLSKTPGEVNYDLIHYVKLKIN